MKRTDKIILTIILTIILAMMLYSIIEYTHQIPQVIGIILGGIYMLFVLCHLAFCAPLPIIILVTWMALSSMNLMKQIEKVSVIIHGIISVCVEIIVLAIIYIAIPIIISMLLNYTTDVSYAWEILLLNIKY